MRFVVVDNTDAVAGTFHAVLRWTRQSAVVPVVLVVTITFRVTSSFPIIDYDACTVVAAGDFVSEMGQHKAGAFEFTRRTDPTVGASTLRIQAYPILTARHVVSTSMDQCHQQEHQRSDEGRHVSALGLWRTSTSLQVGTSKSQ